MSKIVRTVDGHCGELMYIRGNTVFIKELDGKVWYCPKSDIIDFDNDLPHQHEDKGE